MPRKRAKHLVALELGYDEYIALNGGETCGICAAEPKTRKLHRDHDHRSGLPRGLLCFRCNRALPYYADADWLERAAVYVRRASGGVSSGGGIEEEAA